MEFEKYSKMSVGEVATGVATEGGAVIAGLLGAGVLGKRTEVFIKPSVLSTSTMMDKAIAFVANNGVKVAAYVALKKYSGNVLGKYEADVGKGILGSVVLDTVVRASNGFAPKDMLTIGGINLLGNETSTSSTLQMQDNMQRVLQENSSLRQQLNGAMQRIASASPNVTVTPVQTAFPPDHDRQYGMMQTTPEAEDRRKNFGAMAPPIQDERNRKYGAMNKAKLNFAGESDSMATAFGML